MANYGRKLAAGSNFPTLSLPRVGGGTLTPGRQPGWCLLVVYRGRHCPLCKTYLDTLDALLDELKSLEVEVIAVSADPGERASAQVREQGWRFSVGHDLGIEQMHELGLYVSSPRSADETDRPFAEPGLFLINPQGELQVIDVSNAPFARPDLAGLVEGIRFIQDKHYPIRGTMA